MDFEFSADQEMLRESVRRFLADKAPIAYVRDGVRARRTPTLGHDDVWAGPPRHRRDRPARARGARRRGHGHGRRGGRARGARPRRSARRRTRRSAIGAVSLVLAAGAPREHQFLLPGLADGSTIGTLALFEPGARYEWRAPASAARLDGEVWRLDGTKAHVADGSAANLFLVDRASTPTACSACSRCSATTTACRSSRRRPSTAAARKRPSRSTARTAWRLGTGDATDAVAPHARPARGRVRGRRGGRRAARARARGRVRQGAGAVRQADRLVPGRATPLRRHAARARARRGPPATTRAGPPTTPSPTRRTAPR